MFGLKTRFVLMLEWLTLLPTIRCLPQIEQTAMMLITP